jgi:hypothetical protein
LKRNAFDSGAIQGRIDYFPWKEGACNEKERMHLQNPFLDLMNSKYVIERIEKSSGIKA